MVDAAIEKLEVKCSRLLENSVNTSPSAMQFVSEFYKTQEMYDKAVAC